MWCNIYLYGYFYTWYIRIKPELRLNIHIWSKYISIWITYFRLRHIGCRIDTFIIFYCQHLPPISYLTKVINMSTIIYITWVMKWLKIKISGVQHHSIFIWKKNYSSLYLISIPNFYTNHSEKVRNYLVRTQMLIWLIRCIYVVSYC